MDDIDYRRLWTVDRAYEYGLLPQFIKDAYIKYKISYGMWDGKEPYIVGIMENGAYLYHMYGRFYSPD